MPINHPLFCILAIPLFIACGFSQGGGDPLLTTISNDPDLTTFYSLFNGTGGASGVPGPAFEERFNSPKNVPYTVFAPTNDGFENLPEAVIKLLSAPPSYQLLEAILRTHIVKTSIPAEDLNNGSADLTSVQGFKLRFRLEEGRTKINDQAVLSADEPLQAVNGLVYKIDRVIDPFVGYFGDDENQENAVSLDNLPGSGQNQGQFSESNDNNKDKDAAQGNYFGSDGNQGNNGPQNDYQYGSSQGDCTGTMASILLSGAELSTVASALQIIDPLFVKVLSLDGLGQSPIFFAPSNGAFEQAGYSGSPESNESELPETYSKTVQPSNVDLASFLLRFGLVPDGIEDGKAKSISQFDVVIEGGRINNAVVEKIDCGCNGCVARVSRWIDPIYRVFDR